AELYLTTGETEYATVLLKNSGVISKNIEKYSAVLGRVSQKLADDSFTATVTKSVKEYEASVLAQQRENPYGVPYKPYVWGAGWDIQDFGVGQLFLSLGFPDVVTTEYAFNALNFVLGCHPGSNRASFASGVGTESLTVAYGANRDDWSYIPGGIASGTALIRPDFPELKTWPYLWQQAEYVMGGGAADYMLLAMAADALLNR
ncbi:MAG TPA: glycoside hydrolase, partial [Bacteroidota bacterium]|nr:glycoside hydrolase [Bacteroidota bacterium]